MKFGFFTAQALCKIGYGFNKVIRKEKSELMGKIALKICPKAFEYINCTGNILLVTGSDRSSCAESTAKILGFSKKDTINILGGNSKNQIASVLLAKCGPLGKIKKDFVVIEVEDSHASDLLSSLSPDYAVITNLLHTTPEKNGLPEMIKENIEKSITKNTVLILNANDPLLCGLSVPNKKVYFKVTDDESDAYGEPIFGIRCPKCGAKLEYTKVYTAHIGEFTCSDECCDFRTPETLYTAQNIDTARKRMQILGYGVGVSIGGELTYYRISSITAAIALCNTVGIDLKHATSHASAIKHTEEYEKIKFGDRKVKFISVKQDAANFEKALSNIDCDDKRKSVILHLNNRDIQKNISWIFDADISKLNEDNISVIVCGNRAFDLAVRLKLEGFDKSNLKILDDIENIRKHINTLSDEVYLIIFIDKSTKDKSKLINKMHAQLISQ